MYLKEIFSKSVVSKFTSEKTPGNCSEKGAVIAAQHKPEATERLLLAARTAYTGRCQAKERENIPDKNTEQIKA